MRADPTGEGGHSLCVLCGRLQEWLLCCCGATTQKTVAAAASSELAARFCKAVRQLHVDAGEQRWNVGVASAELMKMLVLEECH